MEASSISLIQIKKLDWQEEPKGIEPYPHNISVSNVITQVLEIIGDRSKEELESEAATFSIAGRMMLKRGKGKAGFATIQDRSGSIQIYVRKNDVGEDAFAAWKATSLGDWVRVEGGVMRTKMGEATLRYFISAGFKVY